MSDPEQLAGLETREMEIVDRFGDWHHLIGLKAHEQFWKEGFEMTSRKDFRSECSVQHVRLIGLNSAIVQGKVSCDENRTEGWRGHSAIFRNSYVGRRQGPRHVANFCAGHCATEFPGARTGKYSLFWPNVGFEVREASKTWSHRRWIALR